MKKVFLLAAVLGAMAWPAQSQTILSPMHVPEPVCDASQSDGADISTPLGTPVEAPADGKILRVWNDEQHGCGGTILIQNKDGSVTGLAHLSAFYVKAGEQVSQGEKVADSGKSGNATSPTLHFTLFSPTLGKIDPLKAVQESEDWKHKNAFSAVTVEVLKAAIESADKAQSDPVLRAEIEKGILERWRRDRSIAEAEYNDNLEKVTDLWYTNNGDYKKIPQPLWDKLRELDKYQFKHALLGKEVLSTARVAPQP